MTRVVTTSGLLFWLLAQLAHGQEVPLASDPPDLPSANRVEKHKVSKEVMDRVKLAMNDLKTDPALAAKRAEEIVTSEITLPDRLLAHILWIQGSGLAISEQHTQAFEVLSRAEQVSRDCGDDKTLRRTLRYKSASAFECSRFNEGRDAAIEAIALSASLNDQSIYVAVLHNEAANNESALGNAESAIQHLRKAIEISEQKDDTKGLCQWLVNAANVMLELGQYDQAIDSCQRVLQIEGEHSTSLVTAATHGVLGEALLETGLHSESIRHLQRALVLSRADGAEIIRGTTEATLGNLHRIQNDFPQAVQHYKNSLTIFQEINNPSGIAAAEQALRNLQQPGDVKAHIEAIQKELKQAEASAELKLQISLHQELEREFGIISQWQQSAFHASSAAELERQLQLASFNGRIAALLAGMSHAEKIRLIDELQTEVSARTQLLHAQSRWNTSLIVCICIMLVIVVTIASLMYRMLRALRDVRTAKESLRQQEQIQLKLERRLAEQQKSESLALMASGIAHDFNNLLSGIAGLAELATMSTRVAEKDDLLQQISTTSLQASQLTGQLMQFLGRPNNDAGQCDLSGVLTSMSGLLQSIARPNTVVVKRNNGPLYSEIDDTRLRQVLVNLVANAAEASAGDRVISVSVELIHLSQSQIAAIQSDTHLPPGDYCRVVVEDSGHGMSRETKARLFDPYFSTKGVGRGLGLSSVVGIVRSCSGLIDVESAPGQGCRFSIYFPSVAGCDIPVLLPKVTPSAPQPHIEAGTPRCVLIVDDEALIRDMQAQYLQMSGFRVLTAKSAEEALMLVRTTAETIDCLVTDFCMDGKDGKWLAQQVKLILPGIPVILCSGFVSEPLDAKGDITRVLAKPFSPKLLVKTINVCIQGGRSTASGDHVSNGCDGGL